VDWLAKWLAGRDLPDWLIERTRTLRQWRSAARLASVVIHWRENRFAGDKDGFAAVEAWRKKDKHLYEWEANQRRKAVAWRDDLYRRVAADLSRRYKTAIVEDCNWRDVGRKPDVGENNDSGAAARQRTIAAPGRLKQLLVERFAETVKAEAAYTTQRCHACGELAHVETRTSVWVTCQQCGAAWDQDDNACRNMLDMVAKGPVT